MRELPKKKWEAECVVEDGVVKPTFTVDTETGFIYTSGFLKYFFPLTGKKVKITIEIID